MATGGCRIIVDSATLLGAPVYLVTRPLASVFSRWAHCSQRWRWTLQWRAAASYSVTLLILAVSSTGVLYTLAIHDDWRERLPLQAVVHPLLEQVRRF